MSIERPSVQVLPYAAPADPWRARQASLDRVLLVAWLTAALAFGVESARELVFHTRAVAWTSMWESAPLEVAVDAARGRPIYGDWHHGPVHLAIHGPLYYKTLGALGAVLNADRLEMILIARWAGVAFLAIGVAGVAWFVRSQNGPWWAAVIATGCTALLTPTAMRFVASARPDAMAAALSVLGLTAAVSRRRAGVVVGGVLLGAAWLTKVTAIAAPMAAVFALIVFRGMSTRSGDGFGSAKWRWRRVGLFCAVFLLVAGGTVAGLTMLTDGWFHRHLQVASAAPVSPKYAWFMLTHRRVEAQVQFLFVLPALALLTVVLVRAWRKSRPAGHRPQPSQAHAGDAVSEFAIEDQSPCVSSSGRPLCIAATFFVLSMAVALLAAMRQGSDRNCLIEPTLAAGMLMGTWASRMARVEGRREWLATRAAAVFALCSPMLLGLPDRLRAYDATDRRQTDLLSAYHDDVFAWVRTLPEPLLCLDAWLAFRAGMDNDLNDPVAYASYCAAGAKDPVVERVKRRQYACIVTLVPMDGPDSELYGDIKTLWPGLREAIEAHYVLHRQYDGWFAYTPKDGATASRPEVSP